MPLVPLRAFNITCAYTHRYNDLIEVVGLVKKGKSNSEVSKHSK